MSSLNNYVSNWIQERAEDYPDTGVEGVLSDLFYGGCQSGYVSELIYYTDTVKFYNKYQREIDQMLQEMLDNCGCSISELFGSNWDDSDPLARDKFNQNLLAWFGFEEMARRVGYELGVEF